MQELETMKVTSADGKEVNIKVITILQNPNNDKKFLLYTLDDSSENIDIYASLIKEKDNSYVLESITEEEDWTLIQKTIQELSD